MEQARPPSHPLRRDHRDHPARPLGLLDPGHDGYDDTADIPAEQAANVEDLFESPIAHLNLREARVFRANGAEVARWAPGRPA